MIDGQDGPHSIEVRHGVLHFRARALDHPDVTLTLSHQALVGILFKPELLDQLQANGQITADGDTGKVAAFLGLLEDFDPSFNIITPVEHA